MGAEFGSYLTPARDLSLNREWKRQSAELSTTSLHEGETKGCKGKGWRTTSLTVVRRRKAEGPGGTPGSGRPRPERGLAPQEKNQRRRDTPPYAARLGRSLERRSLSLKPKKERTQFATVS